jgi:hypothetical protein
VFKDKIMLYVTKGGLFSSIIMQGSLSCAAGLLGDGVLSDKIFHVKNPQQ